MPPQRCESSEKRWLSEQGPKKASGGAGSKPAWVGRGQRESGLSVCAHKEQEARLGGDSGVCAEGKLHGSLSSMFT